MKTWLFWNKTCYMEVVIAEARGDSRGLWILKHNGCNISTTILNVYKDTITVQLVNGFLSGCMLDILTLLYWNCGSISLLLKELSLVHG